MCKLCHLQQPVDELVPYPCVSEPVDREQRLYGALHVAKLTCLLNMSGWLLLADHLRVILLCQDSGLMLLQKHLCVLLWPLLSCAERDDEGNCMHMGFGRVC